MLLFYKFSNRGVPVKFFAVHERAKCPSLSYIIMLALALATNMAKVCLGSLSTVDGRLWHSPRYRGIQGNRGI